jgi:triacylglycerol lipase
MGAAKYIGRVGALAVALGIGIALATTPAVAWAEPADSGTSSSSHASSSGASSTGAATSGTAAVSGSSDSSPSTASGSTERSTGSPISQVTSPSGSSHRATRSAEPGVVVSTGGARTGSKTSEDADRAAPEKKSASSSSEPATPTASTPGAPETSAADASAVTQPVKSKQVSAADVTSRQPTSWSAGSGKASGNATRPSASVSAPAPQAVRPSKIDAAEVVSRTGQQLSAKPVSEAEGALSTFAAAPSWTDAEHNAVVTMQAAPTAAARPDPVGAASGMVASLVNAVLNPLAAGAPVAPVEPPTMWTLLAFVRREFEPTVSNQSPAVNPLAGQITNGLITPSLNSQSIDPAITGGTGAPLADVSDLTPFAQPDATAAPATFTGEPSFVAQVTTAAFQILRGFTDFTTAIFGVDTAIPIARLLTSVDPPWFTTLGLNAQRSEFEGMPVWTLQSANPSGSYVVGIHGGAAIFQPSIFNWIDYAAMARNTGATVIVPIYPLAPQGTAATVVPTVADLISSQIDQHGAENVSVYGDSAGGNIALAAVQELVRRGDPVPSHMVLISPALDLTLSNPAMQFIDDPVLSPEILRRYQQWAGDLDLTDPLVSPLYGSLAGLPPTAVYFGSLDVLSPDVLVLQDKALATPGADFTFILRKGLLHNWAIIPWLPEAIAVQPDIYQQLGLGSDT